jgi:hypothetical protein
MVVVEVVVEVKWYMHMGNIFFFGGKDGRWARGKIFTNVVLQLIIVSTIHLPLHNLGGRGRDTRLNHQRSSRAEILSSPFCSRRSGLRRRVMLRGVDLSDPSRHLAPSTIGD